jgi:hypothetical protein
MKPWDLFLPDVLPHCPGCPDLVAEDEIRNAAEAFFDETYTWRVWVSGIVTLTGVNDYAPYLPSGARIVKLHEATLDGLPLDVADTRGGETGSAYKASTDLDVITIGPDAPAPDQTLRVLLSLSLTTSATGLADVLFNSYRMAIANGAIARICRTADKPYTNPTKAATHEGLFREDIERYRWRKSRANSSAARPVQGHYF